MAATLRAWKGSRAMGARDLPEPVRRLIVDCIGSAGELEILLLVHRATERSWTADEVDAELRVGRDRAARTCEA
jgi:hypothetical protein